MNVTPLSANAPRDRDRDTNSESMPVGWKPDPAVGFLERASTQCVDIAEAMLRTARVRYQAFGPDFFSDPAWDVLLLLFVGKHRTREQTVDELSAILSRRDETLRRYLHALEMRGLLIRVGSSGEPATRGPYLTDLGRRLERDDI